jgi:hypothetical protein
VVQVSGTHSISFNVDLEQTRVFLLKPLPGGDRRIADSTGVPELFSAAPSNWFNVKKLFYPSVISTR